MGNGSMLVESVEVVLNINKEFQKKREKKKEKKVRKNSVSDEI